MNIHKIPQKLLYEIWDKMSFDEELGENIERAINNPNLSETQKQNYIIHVSKTAFDKYYKQLVN